MKRPLILLALLASLTGLAISPVLADSSQGQRSTSFYYDVTITNLTQGLSFTPFLVVSHSWASDLLFVAGEAPSAPLAVLAEGGDTGPLAGALAADPRVWSIDTSEGLLGPGESVTVTVQLEPGRSYLSLAAMLLPTNDGMVAIQNLHVPSASARLEQWAYGYDAGSEPNDELCASIPGPQCGGVGGSPEAGGEGYVHIHPGIAGNGDLGPAEYDWKNPIALVRVERHH